MQIDTMAEYVRRRLEHWGEEFALHRDCEYIGHKSKNMIATLIEHRGDMPPRDVGFKPLEVDLEAMQIEDIVTEIARHAPAMGDVQCCSAVVDARGMSVGSALVTVPLDEPSRSSALIAI